jgi:hydrogenase maturation protease
VARRVVIGVGNPDRGDDGVGRAVVQRLRERVPDDVTLLELGGEATSLLVAIEGSALAILVDAAVSRGPPGTIMRLDAHAGPVPEAPGGFSSHGLGVAQAIELARALAALPPRCLVFAITAQAFEPGAALSPAVAAAVDPAAELVLDELTAHQRT